MNKNIHKCEQFGCLITIYIELSIFLLFTEQNAFLKTIINSNIVYYNARSKTTVFLYLIK